MTTRLALGVTACAVTAIVVAGKQAEPEAPAPPAHVTVQHVLIGFKRSVPEKKLERIKEQAHALAEELARRAGAGEEFSALVQQYSDDSYPGIYKLVNTGAPMIAGARKRGDMVAGFGDVAFGLQVGEIGIAEFNYRTSPYGWHVIKRLE